MPEYNIPDADEQASVVCSRLGSTLKTNEGCFIDDLAQGFYPIYDSPMITLHESPSMGLSFFLF